MTAVWLVARREVVTRARGRAFLFSTVALAGLSVLAVMAPRILQDAFEDSPTHVGLMPEARALRDPIERVNAGDEGGYVFTPLEESADPDVVFEQFDLDAIVVTPAEVLFRSEVDQQLRAVITQAVFESSLGQRAEALGLTVDQAQALLTPPEVSVRVIAPEQESDREGRGIAFLATVVLLMAMSFYGNWVLVGVIEEKSNRVVEVLLATVSPIEMLVGKVLGIMALVLLQLVVGLGSLFAAVVVIGEVNLPPLAGEALAMAVIWLVLGLLLYNFLYAAVGSTVSRPEDATSASMPVLMPLMGGYFSGLIYVPEQPDSLISRLLSLFPLTAPLTMPARVVAGGASIAEVGLSIALTMGGVAFMIWLGSRIYAGAILQTQRVGMFAAFRRSRDR